MVSSSATYKELFQNMPTLLGNTNKRFLPSVHDFRQPPNIFSDFFKNKVLSLPNGFSRVAQKNNDCQLTFSGTPFLSYPQFLNSLLKRLSFKLPARLPCLIRYQLNLSTKPLKFFSRQSPTFLTNHSHLALFPLTSKQQS